jgi:ubiquinol-cytochrome c reductase cytochrome c1 subunit
LNLIHWRELVGVVGTEEEIKEMALEETYEDGPDDQGEMFDRPGRLTDVLPKPYPNDNAARAANSGALPPDLSLMKKARVGGEDYMFALLTGYFVPPKGLSLREGLYYNPYFPGGAIGMEQALHDGMVDYDDGTDNSISQMAKDVCVFLSWTAEPEHDERKKTGFKALFLLTLMAIPSLYFKRLKFAPIKTREIRFTKISRK